MKNKLLVIFTCILLVAVAGEVAYRLLQQANLSEAVKEKDESAKADDEAFEKDDAKIKMIQQFSIGEGIYTTKELFITAHTHFTCLVYLSLPEIPPDIA